MEQTVSLTAEEWADVRASIKIAAETMVEFGMPNDAHEVMALFHKVAKQTTYDD